MKKLKTVLPSLKPKVDVPLRSRVVYKITCPCCTACYVGQTIRHLLYRIREHRRPSTPVGAHLTTLEALCINEINPSLNTKDEYRSRALVIKI